MKQPEPTTELSPGELIDMLYGLRNERLALSKTVDELKAQEAAISSKLISMMTSENLGVTGLRGSLASFSIKKERVPAIVDWQQVYTYIKENDAFELLQKRIGIKAWQELDEAGIAVPGLAGEDTFKPHLHKI